MEVSNNPHLEIIERLSSRSFPLDEGHIAQELADHLHEILEQKENPDADHDADLIAFTVLTEHPSLSSPLGTKLHFRADLLPYIQKRINKSPLELVSDGVIAVWRERAKSTLNASAKYYYSRILVLFSYLNGKKADYRDVGQLIQNTIELQEFSGDINYSKLQPILNDTLILILSYSKKAYLTPMIDFIAHIEEQTYAEEIQCNHTLAFTLLVQNKDVKLVDKLEKRFVSNYLSWVESLLTTESKSFAYYELRTFCVDLAEHFKRQGNIGKARNIVKKFCDAAIRASDEMDGFKSCRMLEDCLAICKKYGMRKLTGGVSFALKSERAKQSGEMKQSKQEVELGEKFFENLKNELISDNFKRTLANFVYGFLLVNEAYYEKEAIRSSKEHPFLDMLGKGRQSFDGRTMYRVESVKDDLEGNTLSHAGNHIHHNKFCLCYAFHWLKAEFKECKTDTVGYILDSYAVPENQKLLVESGIKSFFENNYIASISTLVPMVECMTRTIVAGLGGTVEEENQRNGINVMLLGKLIEDEKFRACVGERVYFHLKAIFANPRGENIRNDFCHGLLTAYSFGYDTACLVLHTILLLSCFGRPSESVEPDADVTEAGESQDESGAQQEGEEGSG